MRVLKGLSFILIKAINIFFLLFRVKENRIVFSSYFSKEPEGNIKCVLHELARHGGYDIRTLFMKYDKSLWSKLNYFCNVLKEIYYFNTSRLIVLEGNSLVLAAISKKKDTYALQLWHAAGAFKKFGQDVERIYTIKGLNAAIVSSKNVTGIYAEALNIPEEQIYALGIPRLDPMFDEEKVRSNKEEILAKYPALRGKKVLLYAPTFRGKGIDDVKNWPVDLKTVDDHLKSGYVLAIRLHPLMRGRGLYSDFIDLSYEDLIKTLCAADVLITDYSSIIFEYSALNRPMLFLVPDLAEYKKTRGFYKDFETFVPGKICANEEELIKAMKNGDYELHKVGPFADEYIDFKDSLSTRRVAEFIENLMKKPE